MQYMKSPLADNFPDIIGPSLPQKYRHRRPVGRGTCSTVWTLIDNATEQIVVGKLSDLSRMEEKGKRLARAEGVNIRRCDHPNIIRLLDTHERDEKLLYILEYADAGDLMYQVDARANRGLYTKGTGDHASGTSARGELCYYTESEVLVIMAQLCLAFKYLHGKKIMHRDLKTPNVFLTQSGLVKLGDFGFSRQYDQGFSLDGGTTFCGTPYYLSPELWRRQSYGYKADIWSLGVVLYELMTLRKPFPGNDMKELMQRVLKEGSYNPLPRDRYSKGLCDLCSAMLRVDPQERLSITEVLAMPVILEDGLEYLKVNVPRLRGVEQSIRDRIVWEADSVRQMCSSGSPMMNQLVSNSLFIKEHDAVGEADSPLEKAAEKLK